MAISLSPSATSSSSGSASLWTSTIDVLGTFSEGAILCIDESGYGLPANAVRSTGRDYPVAVAKEESLIGTEEVEVQWNGVIPVLFVTPPPSFNIGDPVYLSTTDGAATLTKPTDSGVVQIQLGTLYAADGASPVATVTWKPKVVGLK